ncbi:hypothetical protein PM082_023474 [Marasmius tenuissimus]|nr:hypothetical protein PM082_020195 [Marasmius tenuissimus]KAJ8093682.1 hypothetical protein PM082_023474 [Marasmius tenuissimus]
MHTTQAMMVVEDQVANAGVIVARFNKKISVETLEVKILATYTAWIQFRRDTYRRNPARTAARSNHPIQSIQQADRIG